MKSVTMPDATKLSWHPAVEAAEHAVHDLIRSLGVDPADARKVLRVEITRNIRNELRDRVSQNNPHVLHDPTHIGPMQIMDISYYVVDTLPEPGWRVLP